jgi:hypothetical protein
MFRHHLHPLGAAAIAVASLAACSSSPASAPASVSISPVVATAAVTPTTTRPSSVAGTSSVADGSAPTSSPSRAPTTTAASTAGQQGVDPNAPEVVEPGDIPDNQVFVSYQPPGQHFFVKVPEGWAQTDAGGGTTTFTDHYNSITIAATTATQAPTVEEMRASGLADLTGNSTFKLNDVKTVQRKAGDGVVATYEIGSDPNPVTGKRALLAVERYAFFHGDTLVTLTLSGAKGADNVDPWRTVTDSLTWT